MRIGLHVPVALASGQGKGLGGLSGFDGCLMRIRMGAHACAPGIRLPGLIAASGWYPKGRPGHWGPPGGRRGCPRVPWRRKPLWGRVRPGAGLETGRALGDFMLPGGGQGDVCNGRRKLVRQFRHTFSLHAPFQVRWCHHSASVGHLFHWIIPFHIRPDVAERRQPAQVRREVITRL